MNVITWEYANDGLISVSYDGATYTILRMADKSRVLFLANVVDKWEPIYGPIADSLNVPRRQVAAIIWQESLGNAHAIAGNGDGGMGLMQITGANKVDAGNLLDPENNIRHGVGLLASLRNEGIGNQDFPALASMYNAGSPYIQDEPSPSHYVPPGTPGARPSHRPWTNEAWLENGRQEKFLTHWGFCTSPGYIDSVVAAQNEWLISRGTA